ncbi:histidinol-phosphate transaminase [bacterium]|nr:histidinol-phosphate transaminase [bacterium]MBU1025945.1 histidinol-phosphate transaminase [bacterium]
MRKLDDLILPHINSIAEYIPGKPVQEVQRELGLDIEFHKLASNENTDGVSPRAIEAIKAELDNLFRYPEHSCFYAKQALTEEFGFPSDQMILGNGAVEIISCLAQILLQPGDESIMAEPSFMWYRIAAEITNSKLVKIKHPDFIHDLPKMAEAVNEKTKLVWVCNPNNPTGTMLTKDEVEDFMEIVDDRCLVVFDEAYNRYVERDDYPDSLQYVREGRNVLVLRTFSKILGLAGLRIGYGFAPQVLISALEKVRPTFSVNSLAQVAVVAGLKDEEFMQKTVQRTWHEKEYFYSECDRLGMRYLPTEANFIFINTGLDSRDVFNSLKMQGVLIRPGWIFGAPSWIRVTISSHDENQMFFSAMEKTLNNLEQSLSPQEV